MRSRAPLALALLVVAPLLYACAGSTSSSSCEAPNITVSPSTVRVGESVKITGRFFTDGCDDMGKGEQIRPLQDQDVVFSQGGKSTTLTQVDSPDGTIAVTVTIPASAVTGEAELQVGGSIPASVTVT